MKALLFINGTPPVHIPNLNLYPLIACTDGAFRYLAKKDFPLKKLSFISGDFDSLNIKEIQNEILEKTPDFIFPKEIEILNTPDQEKTDFHKALEILKSKGATEVDVYGSSGREMDHFLGNLSVASRFLESLNIKFFDQFATYFFLPKSFSIQNVKGKLISLYPFPIAQNVSTKGLRWEVKNATFSLTEKIGIRNYAVQDHLEIGFEEGNLLIFIGEHYHHSQP